MKKVEHQKFEELWNAEIEKKLFRCSKEFGFYHKLKNILAPKKEIYHNSDKCRYVIMFKYFKRAQDFLIFYDDEVIGFGCLGVNRKYPAITAMSDPRHYAQIVSTIILTDCNLSYNIMTNACKFMDKEIYKNQKMNAYMKEIYGFLKLFFS